MACRRCSLRLSGQISHVLPRQHVRSLTLYEGQAHKLLQDHDIRTVGGSVFRRDSAGHIVKNELGTLRGAPLGAVRQGAEASSEHGGQEEWNLVMTIDRLAHAYHFNISEGITRDITSQISTRINVQGTLSEELHTLLQRLSQIFTTKDATHLEISPLTINRSTETLNITPKAFTFDDAASKRQPNLFSLRDTTSEAPSEVEAEKHGLVYIRLNGNIGNVGTGAGLAMATNDAIALYGGKSANFLDAGGQATKETMIQAFGIILRDERVKAILVNIYGGITDGVMIAESIIGAAKELGPLKVPVVVRLQGTNSAEGLKLLEEADLGLYVEADFGAATAKAAELANGAS